MSEKISAVPFVRLAVMASGMGSNAQKLADHFAAQSGIGIELAISDRLDAPVLAKMSEVGIPTRFFEKKILLSEPAALLDELEAHGITHIALAGFLLLLPENLIARYPGRIVNLHPALLPKFGGKGMYGQKVHAAVIAAGERISGITIHEVDARYDEGRILFQATCPVLPEDSPETLGARVRTLEHRWYPPVVEAWALGRQIPESPVRAA